MYAHVRRSECDWIENRCANVGAADDLSAVVDSISAAAAIIGITFGILEGSGFNRPPGSHHACMFAWVDVDPSPAIEPQSLMLRPFASSPMKGRVCMAPFCQKMASVATLL